MKHQVSAHNHIKDLERSLMGHPVNECKWSLMFQSTKFSRNNFLSIISILFDLHVSHAEKVAQKHASPMRPNDIGLS